MNNIRLQILVSVFLLIISCSNSVNPEDKVINNVEHGDHNKKAVSFADGNMSEPNQKTITPEMFGATGDGAIHKLSTKYKNLEDARKDFPQAKDLNITIDGAAFQKAIDIAAEKNLEVQAVKKYAINYPLITRDNTVIDGKNTGSVYNDRSRPKNIHNSAFFIGNHHSIAFNQSDSVSGAYKLYNISGSVAVNQKYVQLAVPSQISEFKTGQLVLVISSLKRVQNARKSILPYNITMSKIEKIEGAKIYFEYPFDESIQNAQIAANGGYDSFSEINYAGVQNVTIRNLTIDAGHLVMRTYGYKCHLENLTINNAIRVIGLNAFAHSTINNITGTFAWRCIEIKTGSNYVEVHNLKASYKPLPSYSTPVDAISFGEYNRNIKIDSFYIDLKTSGTKLPLINLRSRKATITNGIIYCRNQSKAFLKLYNERHNSDPAFGCYGNTVSHVKFYGKPSMKSVIEIGDEEKIANRQGNKNNVNWAKIKNRNKANSDADDEDDSDSEGGTENTPPTNNVITNCLFDGGTTGSVANLNDGKENSINDNTFTKARFKISSVFNKDNNIKNNKEVSQ